MKTKMHLKYGAPSGKLIAAPAAHVDESPASWIQYVCASHQYSITRLENILNVRPRFHDWDLRVSRLDWADALQRANCSPDTFLKAFLSTEYSSHASMGRSSSALNDGPPKYRWCSVCLQEDDRPYLRWWWRFPDSTHCPKHQNRLTSRCANCRSEFVLSYALMVNAGMKSPIPDLSHCQGCGLPRWFSESMEPFDPKALVDRPSISLNEGSERSSDPFQQVKIKLKAARKVRWGKDKFLADDFSLFVGSDRTGKRPVLSINAKVFQAQSNVNFSATPVKWSSRIARWRVPTRNKVAYALRLIRSEMKSVDGLTRPHDAIGLELT
ncbi:MAG: TniQ family protein [Rhodoferax sp.]